MLLFGLYWSLLCFLCFEVLLVKHWQLVIANSLIDSAETGFGNISIYFLVQISSNIKRNAPFTPEFFIAHMVKNVPDGLGLEGQSGVAHFPLQKSMALCISTKNCCFVQSNTLKGHFPQGLNL